MRDGQFGESVGSVNAYQLASPFLLVSEKRAAVVTSTKPRVILPAEEVKRLKRVLAEAPGPMNLDRTTYEIFRGPSQSRLHWTSNGDAAWEKLLRDAVPLMGPVLLRTDLHCYELRVAEDRILLWRQIRLAPPGGVLRLSFFDTTSLRPIGRRSKRRPGDPIVHESGLLAEVDLSGDWDAGVRRVDFPEVMAGIPDLLALVHGIQGWNPDLPKAAWRARRVTVIYAVRPSRSEVEVFPLPWARSVEGHFHWITRVARDPITGKIVGDGAGVKLFLLDDDATFLGWIRPSKETT